MENDNEKDKLVDNQVDPIELEGENKNEEEGNKVEGKIENKNEKVDDKKKEEPKIVFMKKGAYTVHILIQEIKNIEKKDPE